MHSLYFVVLTIALLVAGAIAFGRGGTMSARDANRADRHRPRHRRPHRLAVGAPRPLTGLSTALDIAVEKPVFALDFVANGRSFPYIYHVRPVFRVLVRGRLL